MSRNNHKTIQGSHNIKIELFSKQVFAKLLKQAYHKLRKHFLRFIAVISEYIVDLKHFCKTVFRIELY